MAKGYSKDMRVRAVSLVEAAWAAVEACVPWPLAEPHPALRKIPTSSIADARRRSMLVPRATQLPP